MSDEPAKPDAAAVPDPVATAASNGPAGDKTTVGEEPPPGRPPVGDEAAQSRPSIGEFVRRAVSAGVDAASRSKGEVVRVATSEMRAWLDHLDLDQEIAKVLSRMVVEIKTEIRFHTADDGKLTPDATSDMKIKNRG